MEALMEKPMTEAQFEARRKQLQEMEEAIIARVGWMVRGVFGDPSNPAFAYTIGLHDLALPELIVVGFSDERAAMLLNEVATRLKEAPALRGRLESEHWSQPFFLLDADQAKVATEYAFGAATRSGDKATYVQVVLPDREGKFPWEADCDPHFAKLFPMLGATPT